MINPDIQISKKEKKNFTSLAHYHMYDSKITADIQIAKEDECCSIDLFSLIERNDPI